MVNFKLSKETFSDFIGFLPEIKKWILEILAILYILGMIIVTQYLKEFNISEIKDIKIEYILVGITFAFYILVPIIIIIYLLYVFCKKKMHKVAKKNTQYCKKKYTKNVYFFIDSLLSVLLCNFDHQISINGCGVSICQS